MIAPINTDMPLPSGHETMPSGPGLPANRMIEVSCAIIIPIYNEETSIAGTLERLRKIVAASPQFGFEIVCVNDGSSDGSAQVLGGQDGITVLTHAVNRGYGAALRTGLDYAAQEWIFITDADGTYALEDLPQLLEIALSGVDMVVGAREGIGISSNPFKRMARWTLRKMVHGLTGVMVPDLNSGLRVFKRDLYLDYRHLLPMGFSFTTTLTVASLYAGHPVRYIATRYDRRVGKSNIHPIKDFIRFSVLIVRLASYFEPLNFFLPLSFVLALVGVARGVRDIIVTNALGGLAVTIFLVALQIFVLGVVADVIVKRAQAGAPRSRNASGTRR